MLLRKLRLKYEDDAASIDPVQIAEGDNAELPQLLNELKACGSFRAEGAIEAVGNVGPRASAAVPLLLKAMSSGRWQVREAAAGALGKIGVMAEPVTSALLGALTDPEDVVRVQAAHALLRNALSEQAALAVLFDVAGRNDHNRREVRQRTREAF